MKCGILTFHRAINYGGVLQVYALQKTLEMLGIEAEIIDYYCPSIESLYRPHNYLSRKVLKYIIAALLYNGTIIFNNKGFESFRNQHLNLSKIAYKNEAQLKAHTSEYDFFITGSDQVWSPTCAGFDRIYFLNFVDDVRKKNSSAASFGTEKLPEQLKDCYKELLSKYNAVSVREDSGATIIKELLNENCPLHIDPTLLVTKEQWKKLAVESHRKQNTPYYLIYSIGESKDLIDKAITDGRKDGKKVIYITDRIYNISGVMNLRKVNPDEWVYLIQNADRVYTNSFHGMAFCINFGQSFFVQYLLSNRKANTRIECLLQQFDLRKDIDNTNMSGYLHVDEELRDGVLMLERERAFVYLRRISKQD